MNKIMARKLGYSLSFAFLFTIVLTLGEKLNDLQTIWTSEYNVFEIFIRFILSLVSAYSFFHFLPDIEILLSNIKPIKFMDKNFFSGSKKSFWFCFLFITICHIPAFLAFFPGIFTYDVYYQSNFFFNNDYIEFHPLLHTWLIYLTLLYSKSVHTTIWGVFIYTLVQSICMNLFFAYAVKTMSKFKVPFIFNLIALLYFSLYPTNQVFPLVSTKDVLFCGFVLLFVCLLLECILDKEKFIQSKTKFWSMVATITFMFLFRHNGFHSYILILPLLFIFMPKIIPNNIKKIICMFLIPILLYCGFSVVKKSLGYKPAPIASSISIPLQQMGRVMKELDSDLPEEEKNDFINIVGEDHAFNYFPYCVDDLKFDTEMLHSDFIEESIRQNPKRFILLYLKWAKKYPKEYIDAFLVINNNYFYLKNLYSPIGLHYYLYTENRWSDFFGIRIRTKSILPDLKKHYNEIFLNNSFENNIFLKPIFSMPYNTWFIIVGFFILLYKKKYDLVLAFSIILGIFISVLLGPIVLLRYVYQNFMVIPLLLAFCFSSIEEKNKTEIENNNQLESAS